MTPTQIISAICPSLYSDTRLSIFLQLAEDQTSGSFFGNSRSHAVALRACHMYTLSTRSMGEGGSITSKSEGKLSMSFTQQGGADENLSQTGFGKQLQGLIDSGECSFSVTNAGFDE